jgi:glycerophosphoryl diester phosphodiesterase
LDVWYRGRDAYVRHEHRLGRLPLLVDRQSPSMPVIGGRAIRLPRRYFVRFDFRGLKLGQVLEAADGARGMLIDLKGPVMASPAESFAREVVGLIEERGAAGWTMACGYWAALDAIREIAPQIAVRYTVDTPRRLEAYLERVSAGRASAAVCAYHRLLDEKTLELLTNRGVDVYAWTVDEAAEATALVARGASGIISNDLELLAGLQAPAP